MPRTNSFVDQEDSSKLDLGSFSIKSLVLLVTLVYFSFAIYCQVDKYLLSNLGFKQVSSRLINSLTNVYKTFRLSFALPKWALRKKPILAPRYYPALRKGKAKH